MQDVNKIYMIGVKGAGMTMLADFLAQKGVQISGSDTNEVFMTDAVLKKNNIKIFECFDVKNIPNDIDLVVYSTAYNVQNNAEVAAVKAENFKAKVLTYSEALGEIFNKYKGIAVCGSHGKTTTTAWIGYVLQEVGLEPNALAGARVEQFNGASLSGTSKYLIAEVDEYQNKMQYFNPFGVVLNNIDYDHPDFFVDTESYNRVFSDFIKKISVDGFLVYNMDDKDADRIAQEVCIGKKIKYSLQNKEVDYFAQNIRQDGERQIFELVFQDCVVGDFEIQLSGMHNIANALAVIATCVQLGASLEKIKFALAKFSGVQRRMQILGEFKNALVIDDYAHHPSEVSTTLEGARKRWPDKNLRVFFHPHTFTRTKAFLNDFAKSFTAANEVGFIDIYGSAREKHGGVSSQDLIFEIEKNNKTNGVKQTVVYVENIHKCAEYIQKTVNQNDVIILMGAGDIFRVWDEISIISK